MRTIRLYGKLGELFGESYRLNVKSPAEAIRALCVQLKGFEKYLLESEKNHVGFKVLDEKTQYDEKTLGLFGTGEISIVPVIFGASAESRILAGVVLIAAGYAATVTGFGAAATPFLYNAGVALIIGGAIELMVGKPNFPQVGSNEKADNKPSYLFNGPVNTTAQGHAVPIGYGRMRVGSAVISAAISTRSEMAGYAYSSVTKTVYITAMGTSTNYLTPPPKDYFTREEYSHHVATGEDNDQSDYWVWKYTYAEKITRAIEPAS